MYLLDTNVISELRKEASGKADASLVAWANSVDTTELFLSSITILELEMGVLKVERKDPSQGKLLRLWFDYKVFPAFTGKILSVDADVALQCARLHIPNPTQAQSVML